jgi:hypothetical protein
MLDQKEQDLEIRHQGMERNDVARENNYLSIVSL